MLKKRDKLRIIRYNKNKHRGRAIQMHSGCPAFLEDRKRVRKEGKMLTFRQYLRPQTLEEAYTLCQKKSNIVLGGMLWLKMEQRTVGGVIDLSDLGLDTIEETEEEFRFGAMVTLRQMEQHEGFRAYTQGACTDSVKDIVGVQFRNCATIGGSIFGRFGFSDVLTMFQALDTWVELYHGGLMPLREFAQMKFERDILVRVIVKKTPVQMVYRSMRITKTDFPVVTACVSRTDSGKVCLVLGSLPGRARIALEEQIETPITEEAARDLAARAVEQVTFGSNMRGSAEYRKRVAKTLLRRALLALEVEQDAD